MEKLPVLCRSHDQKVLAVSEGRKIKLMRWPCLKGGLAKSYLAHSAPITAAAFLHGDDRLITCGGHDLCIFQWKHVVEPVVDYEDSIWMKRGEKPKVIM